jgi:limonene-1,2-epoxide hydrolase
MTTTAPSVAHRFATAFNTRDLEQLVEVFTIDVIYHDLFYGTFHGHAGLRELFARMYAEGTHHDWSMTTVVTGEHSTIGEWLFEFTVSDAVPDGAGRILRFPGVSVFETRGDRCHTYREYFDRTAALLAVGITPSSVAGIVRRRPTIEVSIPESETLVR